MSWNVQPVSCRHQVDRREGDVTRRIVLMKRTLFALGAFMALVTVSIALFLLTGYGKWRLDETVEIARPASEVFAWVTEPARLTRWVGWLDEVRDESPGVVGVGQRHRWIMDDPNVREQVELFTDTTRYLPPNLVEFDLSAPMGFTGWVRYQLEDLGGRTRLAYAAEFEYHHWYARLLSPLVTYQAGMKVADDLERLRQLAERE
jgi:uncharacterized protein YndB with AHSA1/START domain